MSAQRRAGGCSHFFPPRASHSSRAAQSLLCASQGQGIFLPEPLKTQPALEGFIIMQMSWIGSPALQGTPGAAGRGCLWERRVEPQIRPVDGWGAGRGWAWRQRWCQRFLPPWEAGDTLWGAGFRLGGARSSSLVAEDATKRHSFGFPLCVLSPFMIHQSVNIS